MQQKKKLGRKVISYVLALVMVLSTFTGIVPGTGIKAHAVSHVGLVDYETIAANDILINNFISYDNQFEYFMRTTGRK